MNKLAIDTSTQTMGISLMKDNTIIAEQTSEGNNDHSTRLLPAVYGMIQQANIAPEDLDHIVVTHGPGSYTGTRIGITTAKSMAWALDIPLTTVSSLELIAYNGLFFNGNICPFIDARRGRVYTGLFRRKDTGLERLESETNIDFTDWLKTINEYPEPTLFLSKDLPAFKQMIQEVCPNAIIPASFVQGLHPSYLFAIADPHAAGSIHEAVPNYLRKTEAETKWAERQENNCQKDERNHG